MWNKKNEEETAPRAVPQPPVYAAPTPARQASIPAVTPEPPKAPTRGASVGPSMTVKGEVFSREELYVDGEIEGSIEMHHRLTVGPNGKIRASVKAKEVVIEGSVHGNVTASEKIIIRVQGSLGRRRQDSRYRYRRRLRLFQEAASTSPKTRGKTESLRQACRCAGTGDGPRGGLNPAFYG